MSGARALMSVIARSIRSPTKCGSPQWRSERCAIFRIGSTQRSLELLRRPAALLRWSPVALETHPFQAYRGEGVPSFANPAEFEYAKMLDYYGVPWLYEPDTFVLERDEGGRVTEAFTPDFYLPEQD